MLIEFDGSIRKLYLDLSRELKKPTGQTYPEDHPFWSSIECHHDLEQLMLEMQTLAPPGHIFGPNIWDPMVFGFWRPE